MYILVEFTDTRDVAVIPDVWLEGTSCAVWPGHIRMASKLTTAVTQKCEPDETWPAFPIKELYRNESYSVVRSKLRRAEMESDVATTAVSDDDSEEDFRRSKRRRRERVFSSDEEEEVVRSSVLPKPPKALTPRSGTFGKAKTHRVATLVGPALPNRASSTTSSSSTASSSSPSTASPLSSSTASSSSTSSSLSTASSSARTEQTPVTPERRAPVTDTSIARDIRMFTLIEKLSQRQEELQDTLGQVLGIVKCLVPGAGVETTTLPEGISFPLTTVEEMEALDEKLEDGVLLSGLVHYLLVRGGRNKTDMCRRIMRHCPITHELAITYNWYGHKNKCAFGKLRLAVAIQKAVMKSCHCTATEVELVCREWFRTASDRAGGRKKRAEKKKASSVDPNTEN